MDEIVQVYDHPSDRVPHQAVLVRRTQRGTGDTVFRAFLANASGDSARNFTNGPANIVIDGHAEGVRLEVQGDCYVLRAAYTSVHWFSPGGAVLGKYAGARSCLDLQPIADNGILTRIWPAYDFATAP